MCPTGRDQRDVRFLGELEEVGEKNAPPFQLCGMMKKGTERKSRRQRGGNVARERRGGAAVSKGALNNNT